MAEKVAIIAASDTHINSKVALRPPLAHMDDGETSRASRFQRALWDSWLDFIDQASRLSEGYRRVVVLNGDIGEMDAKNRSNQLHAHSPAVILTLMLDTLWPLLDIADSVIVVRGTEAHTGRGAWLEEMLARDLDHAIPRTWKKDPNTGERVKDEASWWHLRAKIGGVRFDGGHHAAMGRLPWTEKNAAIKVGNVILYRYLVDFRQPEPNLVIRSHNHKRADSGRNFDGLLVVCTPSWSLKTDYVYRIGQENSVSEYGGDVFLCDGDKIDWHDIRYEPKEARRLWALKI